MGFIRNLTASEIFEQVWRMREDLRAAGDVPTFNVVFMGMGEPLANYDAVLDAVRRMIHPLGLKIGERRITISTCGLAPRIRKLANEGLRVGLAVSLNATTDELRATTMPVTKKYSIAEVLDASKEYVRKARRRVTFEYVLLHGTNDGLDDVDRLVETSRLVPCKINLIPWNPFPGGGHERPQPDWVTTFVTRLMERCHAAVTIRQTRGLDIAAACGQLAVDV
jgi:23S rRNA (adenine2503-C2)-methyltransferase